MAIGIRKLPPTSFHLHQRYHLFSSVHLFSSSPGTFTFLDGTLACVFELQFFSFATKWGRYPWPFAGLLYPLRDFGLYLGSMPASSVSIPISHQAILGGSLLCSQTLQCESTPTSYSRREPVPVVPWVDWLLEAHLDSGKGWILDMQWRPIQDPRMSRWAVFWESFQVGDWGDTCLSGTDGLQVWLTQLGSILECVMNSPAGVGHSPRLFRTPAELLRVWVVKWQWFKHWVLLLKMFLKSSPSRVLWTALCCKTPWARIFSSTK